MPIYEYKCGSCGQVSEFLVQNSGGNNEPHCPGCGSGNMNRVLSMPVLVKNTRSPGLTCCGREERCDTSPCSDGGGCCKH